MGTNGFREDELVSRKVKVGNEWQTRIFPIIGGRLRLAHENNDNLSIQTEIVKLETDFVVVRAAVESQRGKFNGTGTASGQRDAKLADSLVELAETRAIARALRFGGIGVEYTGAEEVSHVVVSEPEREQTLNKEPAKAFPVPQSCAAGREESKPQHCGNGRVTSAQLRALWALTKKARYTEEDIASVLSPLNASTFQDLTRESASQLISSLQTEVAA
ncbi:MAG: hypothetical protein HY912_11975 [Desulfomonile tiedjei]|uniref:Uncharacterized protein n=1 Tax=Desulfomonile tiedjei TaxID=2358 RepID=A0A9D6V3R8_9BACT|nr:hypothetical protein [Desulfomonile tiedjei]